MTQSSAITIPDASAITVDTSCIDVSEVESQEDKDFLMEKGEKILRIVAKAALEVGQKLVEIQEHFNSERKVGLLKYYESLGLDSKKVSRWTCKYRAYVSYVEMFGEEGAVETFDKLGDDKAQRIWTLPADYRRAFLEEINEGNIPTRDDLVEVQQDPEVKLTKAQELLERAKSRKEAAQQDLDNPDCKGAQRRKATTDAFNSDLSIANFEQQIADLKAEIEAEKLKTKQAEEQQAKMETELQKIKFDDATIRADRIRRVSNTLLASVPAVMADVQRFYAEIEHYDKDTVLYLEEQLKTLIDYTKDHL